MVRVIVALCSILFALTSHAYINVSASIDKNPVVTNESFILTVVAEDDVNTNALDTSSLLADFIVGRTSVSSQTSMVNFNTTRTTTWTTVLIPRREGSLTIPALDVDGEKTQAISVNVVKASELPANVQQDIFISSDISSAKVYVQQQLTLTVRLHFATELKRGSLTEPTLDTANILQIGKDKETEAIINGRRYRIIERVYAISPQKSGEFTLKSPVFSGEVVVASSRRSNFLSFANTKPISIVGDDIKLSVEAIPSNVTTTWLPSELLALHDEWQPKSSEFKVGEPITRTVTLTAAGLSEEQLPNITMDAPKGLKIYPDQAELHTGLNNERLVSQKVINFAIVASKPGEYLLPELSIPWWNTVTNKAELATLPSQKVIILPNSELADNFAQNETNLNEIPAAATQPKIITIEQSSIWQWVFLSLWLLTCLAWYLSAQRNKAVNSTSKQPTPKANNAYLALIAACKKNDGKSVIKLLIPWAQTYAATEEERLALTTIDNLHSTFNNSELSHAIIELQQHYYGPTPKSWNSNSLLSAIQVLHKNHIQNKTVSLININPA